MEVTKEQIKENCQEMLSYHNMRVVLQGKIRKATGYERTNLKQILEVLDLVAELVRHSDNDENLTARIYEILS